MRIVPLFRLRLRPFVLFLGLILLMNGAALAERKAADPLPSWNSGQTKQAILVFVKGVTDRKSSDYVPPAERIAVFDNDGTLWAEQPLYFQGLFALDRVKALAPQHPEWKARQPFKAVLENDLTALAAGGEKGLVELLRLRRRFWQNLLGLPSHQKEPKIGDE